MNSTVPIHAPMARRARTGLRECLAGALGLMALCSANADQKPSGGITIAGNVPAWAFGDSRCAATLIAPRVLLSAYYCIGREAEADMKQLRTGQTFRGKVVLHPSNREAVTQQNKAPAVPGLILLSDPVPLTTGRSSAGRRQHTVPLPAYGVEKRLLKDPVKASAEGHDATEGTRLSAYSGHVRPRSASTPAYRHVSYRATLSTSEYSEPLLSRPLVYRSVSRLRLEEPERFAAGLAPAPGEDPDRFEQSRYDLGTLLRQDFGAGFTRDRDIDDVAITTVGVGKDRVAGTWNPYGNAYPIWTITPFVAGDWGAGLLAEHRSGKDYLVGVVQGPSVHPRMSAHWPWVYETLMAHGMKDDARIIATQVLGPRSADCASARLGEICLRATQDGLAFDFFRRIGLTPNGGAALPVDGRDGEDWEFLGTRLPDRRAGTTRVRTWDPADVNQAPVPGALYARFNGKSRQVEYFKRKTAQRALPYDAMPLDGGGNGDWAYLGTDPNPSRSASLSPLPGSAPAPRAPAAAPR